MTGSVLKQINDLGASGRYHSVLLRTRDNFRLLEGTAPTQGVIAKGLQACNQYGELATANEFLTLLNTLWTADNENMVGVRKVLNRISVDLIPLGLACEEPLLTEASKAHSLLAQLGIAVGVNHSEIERKRWRPTGPVESKIWSPDFPSTLMRQSVRYVRNWSTQNTARIRVIPRSWFYQYLDDRSPIDTETTAKLAYLTEALIADGSALSELEEIASARLSSVDISSLGLDELLGLLIGSRQVRGDVLGELLSENPRDPVPWRLFFASGLGINDLMIGPASLFWSSIYNPFVNPSLDRFQGTFLRMMSGDRLRPLFRNRLKSNSRSEVGPQKPFYMDGVDANARGSLAAAVKRADSELLNVDLVQSSSSGVGDVFRSLSYVRYLNLLPPHTVIHFRGDPRMESIGPLILETDFDFVQSQVPLAQPAIDPSWLALSTDDVLQMGYNVHRKRESVLSSASLQSWLNDQRGGRTVSGLVALMGRHFNNGQIGFSLSSLQSTAGRSFHYASPSCASTLSSALGAGFECLDLQVGTAPESERWGKFVSARFDYSLAAAADLVRSSSMALGVGTAPIDLACALGVPTVVLAFDPALFGAKVLSQSDPADGREIRRRYEELVNLWRLGRPMASWSRVDINAVVVGIPHSFDGQIERLSGGVCPFCIAALRGPVTSVFDLDEI